MKNTIGGMGVPLLILALLFPGCSSIDVNHDFDPDANFYQYTTYGWLEQPTTSSGSAREATMQNQLLDKRIKNAVNAQMTIKGFTQTASNPELLLKYHTGVQDRIDVTDWGYTYHGRYWGWQDRDISVYNYTEGTLILDFIDSKTKELVWRASATATVDPNATPEQRDKLVNEAAAKMIEKYPPKK
jgi:hypothetical protein